MKFLARALFRYRRSAAAGFFVRQVFAHASPVLPVRRVAESDHVLAFHHPVPAFAPVHVLLVPKLAVPTLMHFTPDQREAVASEVATLAPRILGALGRSPAGFLVVVNGGPRQDVRQVHFHLVVDGYPLSATVRGTEPGVWTEVADRAGATHQARLGPDPLRNGLHRAAEQHDALQLERRGYSVIWDARINPCDVVHLVVDAKTSAPT